MKKIFFLRWIFGLLTLSILFTFLIIFLRRNKLKELNGGVFEFNPTTHSVKVGLPSASFEKGDSLVT